MKDEYILVVDDDDRLRETLGILVRSLGHRVELAAGVKEASALLARSDFDLVISDLRMHDGSGIDLLEITRRADDDVPFILLTAYATIESAVDAMKKGAFDYLQKPFDASEVELRIARALDQRRRRAEYEYLRDAAQDRSTGSGLIGISPALLSVLDVARRVAVSDASVLITGETGTGKELVAQAIHNASPRAERLLVPLNLSAVPEELLESELFGHTRGAFTGASAHRQGKFELADGGTLFLDEVGDVPLRVQTKLLRALQEQTIERVGSNLRRSVDVRVISATNRDLEAMIKSGDFRMDLYYRLRVVEIHLPPLRDRREDIPYLAGHFLRKHGAHRVGGVPAISDAALRALERYEWPGNVRELENAIERAIILCTGDVITASLIDVGRASTSSMDEQCGMRLDSALDQIEKDTILRALDDAGGIKARAARALGVSERTLWYKLRKHELK